MDFRVDQKAEWRGDNLAMRLNGASAAGLTAAAIRLRALSIPRTPLDQGPLRESATVTPAAPVGDAQVASVSFDTPYAVIQHERADFNHSVGGAKFLEGPLAENRRDLMKIIALGIRGAFS